MDGPSVGGTRAQGSAAAQLLRRSCWGIKALLRCSCGGAAGATKRSSQCARKGPERRSKMRTNASVGEKRSTCLPHINLYHIFDLQPFWFPPFCSGPLPSATDVDRDAHAVPGVRLSATADKGLVDAKPAVLPQTQHPPVQLL